MLKIAVNFYLNKYSVIQILTCTKPQQHVVPAESNLLPADLLVDVVETFKALGDPTRAQIIAEASPFLRTPCIILGIR
jgi:hypothetical protein